MTTTAPWREDPCEVSIAASALGAAETPSNDLGPVRSDHVLPLYERMGFETVVAYHGFAPAFDA